MASYVKFNTFVGDLGLKVHNLNTDTIKIYLTNTAPNTSSNAVKGDLAEISTGNGYSGPISITNAYSQTSGTGSLTSVGSTVVTATGSVGPFRYIVLYNDTPASPLKPLIGYWDYGSSITMANTETFTITFGATVLTIT
jgi:hypothetical protein